jgi:sugar phosphate isomerase/epimerase
MPEYKLGVSTLSKTPFSHTEQLQYIKNAGFDAFFTMWTPAETEQIANQAARLGLYQQSIHAPFSKAHLMWEDGDVGDDATKELIDCVKDCARFNIPIMVVHTFKGFKDHSPNETGITNFGRVVDAADKHGVKVAFENIEGEEYLFAVMDRYLDADHVGFCYDTGHQLCYNPNTDMLEKYGHKLIHTHINDNLGVRGDEITWHDDLHLMPTDGIVDWGKVIKRIKELGYKDILMSELCYAEREGKNGAIHRYNDLPMDEYMALAYKKITAAIAAADK